MAIESYQRTVTTSATALTTETGVGRCWLVANRGSASVYLGGSTVTSSTGFELKNTDAPQRLEVSPDNTVYAIAGSGTVRVDVLTV